MSQIFWPNGNLKELRSDTNKDGKPDVISYYDQKGQLYKMTRDRNFDGKVDEITYYLADRTVIETDELFNGEFNFREEHIVDKDTLVIKWSRKSKETGKFEIFRIKRVPREQEETATGDDCHCGLANTLGDQGNLLQKVASGAGSLGELRNDYYVTDYGFKVQKSCVDKLGADYLNKRLLGMLKSGFSCQETKGEVGATHVHRIAALLLNKSHPVKLMCKDLDDVPIGERSVARAVVKGSDSPAIALDADLVKKKYLSKTDDHLEGALFHEMFHLIGYVHSVGVDYPYACEGCCFYAPNAKSKADMCSVCAGRFKTDDDRKYVEVMVEFFKGRGNPSMVGMMYTDYLEMHPHDRWARLKYIELMSAGGGDGLSVETAKIFREEFKGITREEEAILSNAEHVPMGEELIPYYKPIARAYVYMIEKRFQEAQAQVNAIEIPPEEPAIQAVFKNYKDRLGEAIHAHISKPTTGDK